MHWLWYLFLPLILYLCFLFAADMRALYRTFKYKSQGFKWKYVPVAGQVSLFLPNKKKPNDGMANFKAGIGQAEDYPGLVINDTRSGTALIYLTDLALIKEFFIKEPDVCVRAEQEDLKFSFSFFYNSNERAVAHRMIFSEMFRVDNIETNIPLIKEVSDKHFSNLVTAEEGSKVVDFIDISTGVLKELADGILFGSREECPRVEDEQKTLVTEKVFQTIKELSSMKAILNPLNLLLFGYPNSMNLLPGSRDAAGKAELCKAAIEKCYNKRAEDPKYKLGVNILDLMIKNNKSEGEHKFTMTDITGDMALFLFAGSDSTSKTLMTCIYMLGKHPEIAEQIYKDIDSLGLAKSTVKFEDLDKSDWLNAFLKECLRLKSPAPASFDRKLLKNFKLGKYDFTAGDKIVIPYCYLHTTSKFFSAGENFDVKQFMGEEAKKIQQTSYIPFGAGKRMCLGRLLAETILKISIISLLSKYSLWVDPADQNSWTLGVGVDIGHCKVKCTPRDNSISK